MNGELLGAERAAMALVIDEVVKAGVKFGQQNEITDDGWLSILVEEVGEAAKDLNDRSLGKLPANVASAAIADEVVQVAAVAIRWLAAMGRR